MQGSPLSRGDKLCGMQRAEPEQLWALWSLGMMSGSQTASTELFALLDFGFALMDCNRALVSSLVE